MSSTTRWLPSLGCVGLAVGLVGGTLVFGGLAASSPVGAQPIRPMADGRLNGAPEPESLRIMAALVGGFTTTWLLRLYGRAFDVTSGRAPMTSVYGLLTWANSSIGFSLGSGLGFLVGRQLYPDPPDME